MVFEKILILILNFTGLASGIITIILWLKKLSKTKNSELIKLLETIGKASEMQILLNHYEKYFRTQSIVTDLKKCEIHIYRSKKTPILLVLSVFTFLWVGSIIGIVNRPLFEPNNFIVFFFHLHY